MGIDLNKIVSFRKYYNSFMLFGILIAVFQMFIQFNFNADAIKIMSEVDYTIPVWFTSLNIIMILFLFVYQHYISLYIFDEQVKKIGILFGIGVNKGYLCKYLYKKWCYFFLISVIGGISLGTTLYVLIFQVLKIGDFISVKDISVVGSSTTFAVVLITYIVNIVYRIRFIKKSEIKELLTYERKVKKVKYPKIYTALGVVSLLVGIYFLKIYQVTSYGVLIALIPILCFTLAAYFLIMTFSDWYEGLLSLSLKKYLKRLFFISRLRIEYKDYAKLLVLCATSIIFGLYILFMNIAMSITPIENYDVENPYDFVAVIDGINDEKLNDIQKFELEFTEQIESSQMLYIQEAKIKWDNDDYNYSINIMSEKNYSNLTGKPLGISGNEAIVLTQMSEDNYSMNISKENGVKWGFQPPGDTEVKINEQIYNFKIVGEIWEEVYNIERQDKRTYIIPDKYYESLFVDGKKQSVQYFVKVKEEFRETHTDIMFSNLKKITDNVTAKSDVLNFKKENRYAVSVLLFVPIVLIFIALSGLISLRLDQNFRKNKLKYKRLLYLGYTNMQVLSELKKEIFMLFFIPFVLGTILSVIYTIFSINQINTSLLVVICIATLIFSCIEIIFCKLAIKLMKKNIVLQRLKDT